MQRFIDNSLESNWLWLTARICLALMFVASGLAKLFDYQASLEEMRAAGLEPAWLFNIATAVTLLAGSALVLLDRKLWLGAGALAIVDAALERLEAGGSLLLYTGVAMVEGGDPFLARIRERLASREWEWDYQELDPDVFAEELDSPAYREAERIAVVGLRVTRRA